MITIDVWEKSELRTQTNEHRRQNMLSSLFFQTLMIVLTTHVAMVDLALTVSTVIPVVVSMDTVETAAKKVTANAFHTN